MLEIDVAGLATVDGGRHRDRARARTGIRFELLDETHPQLGELVGAGREVRGAERSALEARPARPRPEGRRARASRSTCASRTRPTASALFWRLLVVAEAGSRFSADRGVLVHPIPSVAGYSNARRRALRRARTRRSSTSRCRTSRSETWHFASHRARGRARRRARLGRRRLRLEEGQGPDRERPRRPGRDVARHGRVLRGRRRSISTTTRFQEHHAPNTTSDFAFKGALRDEATAVWRGMIRVEREGAEKTNAYQENRNLILSPDRARGLDPRPGDPCQRRPLHARRHDQPGRPRAAVLRDVPRPHAQRRGETDRARLLPGRARPHRAGAGARGTRGRARSAHPAKLEVLARCIRGP